MSTKCCDVNIRISTDMELSINIKRENMYNNLKEIEHKLKNMHNYLLVHYF